jgi:lysozyme
LTSICAFETTRVDKMPEIPHKVYSFDVGRRNCRRESGLNTGPKNILFFSICVLLVNIALSTMAGARDESSWSELTNEPSRATLFKEKVIPDGMSEEAKSKGDTLALPSIFVFPTDALNDTIEDKPRENCIFGIDLSHYDSKSFRFDLLKLKHVGFVYVKATQGINLKDQNFSIYWKKLSKLERPDAIYKGAYHFLSSEGAGKDQADSFVDYVNMHGGFQAGDLPPVIDLEWDISGKSTHDRWSDKSPDYIIATVKDCLQRIEARTHRKPIVYTAASWFSSSTIPLTRCKEFGDYPIWIADYNRKRKLSEKPAVLPNVVPVIWQFTDSAKFNQNVGGDVDASIFYGTATDFKKTFELP